MNGTCTGTIFLVPTPGAFGRGQKFNFLNMVMLHIKLKGKAVDQDTLKKLTYDQTGDLGMTLKNFEIDFVIQI